MRTPTLILFVSLTLSSLIACSDSSPRTGFGTSGGTSGSSGGDQDAESINFDGGINGGNTNGTPIGKLKGTVYAPNGDLPIPGALIYLSSAKPEAIPDNAYCDRCVTLPSSTPQAKSGTNGKFEINTYTTGDQYLVIQKGQFRKVKKITVVNGDVNLDDTDTTLPSRTSGDNTIPKMAVVQTTNSSYDMVQDGLSYLGIEDFDLIGDGSEGSTGGSMFDKAVSSNDTALNFLKSSSKMKQYHVVFLPCGVGGALGCYGPQFTDSTIKSSLKSFVQAGGKLYATDFAYEHVKQTWPEPITWGEDNTTGLMGWGDGTYGKACTQQPWEGNATWNDTGLKDWMSVINQSSATLAGNWTTMQGVNAYNYTDETGASRSISPTVWASAKRNNQGNELPTTVSFPDGCGRVLFSTYHTEAGDEHKAQVDALLYILLEVNTCLLPGGDR